MSSTRKLHQSIWNKHNNYIPSNRVPHPSKNLKISKTLLWLSSHASFSQTVKTLSSSHRNRTHLSSTTWFNLKSPNIIIKVKMSVSKSYLRRLQIGIVKLCSPRMRTMKLWSSYLWSRIRRAYPGNRIRIDLRQNLHRGNRTARTSPAAKYLKLRSCKYLRPQFSNRKNNSKFSLSCNNNNHPTPWKRLLQRSCCLTLRWPTQSDLTLRATNWHSNFNLKLSNWIAAYNNLTYTNSNYTTRLVPKIPTMIKRIRKMTIDSRWLSLATIWTLPLYQQLLINQIMSYTS